MHPPIWRVGPLVAMLWIAASCSPPDAHQNPHDADSAAVAAELGHPEPPLPKPGPEISPAQQVSVLYQATRAHGQLSRFASLLKRSGLDTTLAINGPYTLLAPTDAALQRFAALQSLQSRPSDLLAWLKGHVLQGRVVAADLAQTDSLTTLAGTSIAVERNGRSIRLNGTARIVQYDVEAANCLLQAVDEVLLGN